MLGVAASRGLELGLQSSLVRSSEFAGEAPESRRRRRSKRCDVQVRIELRFRSIVAALDPAVPNQRELSDFQWPSIRVGRRNQGGGGEVEREVREVKAGAKEKWAKHNESALSGDTPLPLPMAYPGTEPLTKKEMDAQFSCDPELQVGCFNSHLIRFDSITSMNLNEFVCSSSSWLHLLTTISSKGEAHE